MVDSLLGDSLCCASCIVHMCVCVCVCVGGCARPCGAASGAWLSLYCLPGTQVWCSKHSELVSLRFMPLCYIMKLCSPTQHVVMASDQQVHILMCSLVIML
jgi:hypothetical protein